MPVKIEEQLKSKPPGDLQAFDLLSHISDNESQLAVPIVRGS